jgi:glutamate 5-kinase
MGSVVVKLGSSIVCDERGEPRAEVLGGICDQLAELYAAGREPVVVTSGAIARGMGVRQIPLRPRAIDELQAASAVGQGKLYQVYDELLRARGVPSAQVLLTFFDISARTHYVNARQTLRKLLDWRVVPVINENDTTTTDEISFGNNDFLAAQVAILLGAQLLVLLTDSSGVPVVPLGAALGSQRAAGINAEGI